MNVQRELVDVHRYVQTLPVPFNVAVTLDTDQMERPAMVCGRTKIYNYTTTHTITYTRC